MEKYQVENKKLFDFIHFKLIKINIKNYISNVYKEL